MTTVSIRGAWTVGRQIRRVRRCGRAVVGSGGRPVSRSCRIPVGWSRRRGAVGLRCRTVRLRLWIACRGRRGVSALGGLTGVRAAGTVEHLTRPRTTGRRCRIRIASRAVGIAICVAIAAVRGGSVRIRGTSSTSLVGIRRLVRRAGLALGATLIWIRVSCESGSVGRSGSTALSGHAVRPGVVASRTTRLVCGIIIRRAKAGVGRLWVRRRRRIRQGIRRRPLRILICGKGCCRRSFRPTQPIGAGHTDAGLAPGGR